MTLPQEPMPAAVRQLGDRLVQEISGYESVLVAFSGGVDSALVALAAHKALGERACAVTALSPSLASGELELATQIAQEIGTDHRVIETSEFETLGYTKNDPSRCFFCKSELYTRIEQMKQEMGFAVIANGANTDDLGDYRPGLKAARDFEARSPLVDVGLSKADVRNLARCWGLRVWDKPAMPCLSSRVAYGLEVTPERVSQIDQCEKFLRNMGFEELRVRYTQEDVAKIELPLSDMNRLMEEEVRSLVIEFFRSVGFKSITLDLEGFRSGSMNAFIPSETLKAFGVTMGSDG